MYAAVKKVRPKTARSFSWAPDKGLMRRTGWEAFWTMVVPLPSRLMSGTRSWEEGMVMLKVVLGKVMRRLPWKLGLGFLVSGGYKFHRTVRERDYCE